MNALFFSTAMTLTLAALVFYWPSIADWVGEFRVGMALAGLPKQRYTLLHHLLISGEHGQLLRIDHLICGPAGYFVIESLPLTGHIRGESSERQWIRISTSGNRFPFPNPLRQNEQHVEALRHIVGKVPIYNLVVFSRARLSKQRQDGILTPTELTDHILNKEEEVSFDSARSMKALRREMITSSSARRRTGPTHNWRRPVGHVLIATAACVIAFAPVPRPAAEPHVIVRYKPVRASLPPTKKTSIISLVPKPSHQRHVRHSYRHHHRHRARAHHFREPMQVIAMSNGMASILENGRVITLHSGQSSPHGWKLVRATPRYTDMIGPHGHHFHFTP